MGVLLAFVVGYAVGARSGREGYRDVVDAVRTLRESDEVRDFAAAMRSHAGSVLHELGDRMGGGAPEGSLTDLLARLRDRGAGDTR